MDKSIFGFTLRYSKKQQVVLLLMIVVSYPFYYLSLDLPKTIINEAIEGGVFPITLLGYELDRIGYLLVLCFAFLGLVLINGGFKYFVNVYRGIIGERMLRRLRYILVNRVMRFPLHHFRNISEGEIVSMVSAETEPLGGFVGDSISLPAFQGGMLITALIFMFVQDPILGIAAIALYPIQGWGIPKLQRRVNLLNKERVQHVRKLSERLTEMVAGSAEIHAHDTSQYELADFSDRLGAIFNIRYQVYRKKFFIKFLNNFLAQVTPFFFYSIGGYLVITGDLSIGALVAVLAAYKDLAPPWKELLNYYQRMEDAKIKYHQLIERFDPPNMFSEDTMVPSLEGGAPVSGQIVASNLTLEEDEGTRTLENAGFAFGVGDHVAITGRPGGSKSAVARLIARQVAPTNGSLTLDGIDMTSLPEHITGRQLGYVDQDAYIRSGSIRDNLFYGLKHHPQGEASTSDEALGKRLESELSGNSPHDINGDWLDQKILPHGNGDDLLQRALQALRAVDLEDDILSIGLRSTIDPETHPKFASSILQARTLIQEKMKSSEFEGLVESWDRDSYNSNASVAENILFGTPVDDTFDIEALGKNEIVLAALNKVGLYDKFIEMGWEVASFMVELFRDLQPGHEFFERFSFISADDLPDFQVILNISAVDRTSALSEEQCVQLLQLPFRLIQAKHRLSLIDSEMEERLLTARKYFEEDLPSDMLDKISFFGRDTYNPASSVLDNTLFGKINASRSDTTEKIQHLVISIIDELDLRLPILESGLGFEVGISGRRLSVTQRQKLAIARNLIKDPQLLIVNEATSVLDSTSQASVFEGIRNAMKDRGLVWVDDEVTDPAQFDRMFLAEAGKIKEMSVQDGGEFPVRLEAESATDSSDVGTDTELLARIPFFAGLDRSRLKLLAFTSERQTLETGEDLIKQGETGEVAFVVVEGTFSIIAETQEGQVKISDIGRGGVIGELALLCEAPRTATVKANEQSTVLKIDKDVFIKLIKDNPAVGENLSHILASKLESMMRSMHTSHESNAPISALLNRNMFIDTMKTTVDRDKRNDRVSSLLLIDFEGLNDLQFLEPEQHQTIQQSIAARLGNTIRAADSIGSLSAYQYGIIARRLGAEQSSSLLLERIADSLHKPLQLAENTIDLKAIQNIQVFELDSNSLQSLLEKI